MSQFSKSGGQSIGVSASASVLPMNIQDWFPLGLMVGSPWCPRDSQESSPSPQFESMNSLWFSLPYEPALTSIHDYWKNQSFDYMNLCQQSDVSAFYMQSRLVIAFLPKGKCLLISWLQSPSAVISEPKKIEPVTIYIVSPSICHEVMGPEAMIFIFLMLSFKPAFSLSFFTSINRLFSSSWLPAIRVVSSVSEVMIFLPAMLIPACASSSLAFHLMYSAYKLNKQDGNTHLDIFLSQFGTSPLFHVCD